jgi:hypothetical protein
MNNPIRIALATGLLAALPAVATVTVSFPSPTYADIGRHGSKEADDVKNDLARHIHALDAKYLKPGDNLWVEVIEVDLAGDRVVTGMRDYRVTRGKSDIPTIVVRYRLERDGKTTSGEDTLRELGYQQSTLQVNAASESLHYEKRLLDNWFKERFAR